MNRRQPFLFGIKTSNQEESYLDKVYIDNNRQSQTVELPKYGEVKLIVKDGKVVQYVVIESHILADKNA